MPCATPAETAEPRPDTAKDRGTRRRSSARGPTCRAGAAWAGLARGAAAPTRRAAQGGSH